MAFPARANRPVSSLTSPSTGRRGARLPIASGTSRRCSSGAPRSRWRSSCGCSASPGPVDPSAFYAAVPEHSPLVGDDRLERAGLTAEIAYPDPTGEPEDAEIEYAVEITYEGLYELAEETVADGTSTLLDDHFGALGGWIASTLVKLGDLQLAFLPAEDLD